jgi:hypothetical protein
LICASLLLVLEENRETLWSSFLVSWVHQLIQHD